MTAIDICFSGDPRDQLDHEDVLQEHRTFIEKKLVPLFLKYDLDFRYIHYTEKQTEEESSYDRLHLIVKCSWSNNTRKEVSDCLCGVPGITYTTYPDCMLPDCYEPVATHGVEKLNAPLYNRHGEEPHDCEQYCLCHLSKQDRAILRTIETVDEPLPQYARKDQWIKITSWKLNGRWYAQWTQNDWDGDWESGYYEYCYGSAWQSGKTREQAIEKARDCE